MAVYCIVLIVFLSIVWSKGSYWFRVFHFQMVAAYMKRSGPEVIKLFSCSTQLSMKFFMLINVKMPTIIGILTFMNGKNNILGLSEPGKPRNS